MELNPVQQKLAEIRSKSSSAAPQTPPPGSVAAKLAELRAKDPVQQSLDETKADLEAHKANPTTGFFSRVGADLGNRFGEVKQTLKDTAEGKINPLSTGLQVVGKGVAGSLNDIIGEGLKSAIDAAPDFVKQPVHNAISSFLSTEGGKAVVDAAKQGAEAYASFKQAHPEIAKDAESVLNIAQFIPSAKVAEVAAETGIKGATKAVEAGGNAVRNKAISSVKDAWAKPASMPKGFKKAAAIFKRAEGSGHDIPETLMSNGVLPSEHIANGVFDTADTADSIREQAMKTSHDLLRPAISQASPHVPRTPVSDIVSAAKSTVERDRSMVQETKDALLSKLEHAQSSMEKKYPNGMSLEDLHDEKIVRGMNTKRSPIGDVSANMEAQKNEALRDVLKTAVEEKAPPEIPVKEFNDVLTKQNRAADYLEALHGIKVPTSLLGKISKGAAKIAGAGVGGALGGGVMGNVGGYHMGGMIEELLSNIPGKMRDSVLKNLETTNPKAFAKVSEYLKTEHPIPLGPASAPKMPVDTSGSIPHGEFDTAVNDALAQMKSMKDEEARAFLKNLMETRKPSPPPVRSVKAPKKPL